MWDSKSKSGNSKNEASKAQEVFKKFCDSSTIHGTYFWGESDSWQGRIFWILVVMTGVSGAVWIINNSFKAWDSNPVITAVSQIPIESVPFPSVVICPLDKTRHGYFERRLNNEDRLGALDLPYQDIFLEILKVLRKEIEPDNCLVEFCLGNEEITRKKCPQIPQFEDFTTNYTNSEEITYNQRVVSKLKDFSSSIFSNFPTVQDDGPIIHGGELTNEPPDCSEKAKDFQLLVNLDKFFPRPLVKSDIAKPGSLLRWLLVQMNSPKDELNFFQKYLKNFQSVFSSLLNNGTLKSSSNLPIPELVDVLTESESSLEMVKSFPTSTLKFDHVLLDIMRQSLQSSHVIDNFDGKLAHVPGAAFPFCHYDKQTRLNSGILYGPYDERYCNSFQTTLNENGVCYTFNNHDLGTKGMESEGIFSVTKVQGCGKSKGLRIVADNNKLAFKAKQVLDERSMGFSVYVTVPGVVTHKVPFVVDPTFAGEYNFLLHGIHFIDASETFVKWNKEKKACYFPTDRNLTFFKNHYTQDNCLLECKLKKVSDRCGCSPWFLDQANFSMCNVAGNKCIKDKLKTYTEDLTDREECDCKVDCGMIHFFASVERHPYTDRSMTDPDFYFNPKDKSGLLSNYLLDSKYVFSDVITDNLTQLLYGKTKLELAEHRFNEDITIMNFFFDTPIITRITLEMRISIFDQISAIGGTLGLFTGVSLITFVEVLYWLIRFVFDVGLKLSNPGIVETFPQKFETKSQKMEISPRNQLPAVGGLEPKFGFI